MKFFVSGGESRSWKRNSTRSKISGTDVSTAHIVNADNEYFCSVVCGVSRGSEDESYRVAQWSRDIRYAYTYSSQRAAKRALENYTMKISGMFNAYVLA